MMDDGLKKRLIGAAVLASLAVIFVPMLFEEPPSSPPPLAPLPSPPPISDFASEKLRDEIPAITPLAPVAVENESDPADDADDGTATPEPAPRTGLSAWVVQAASLSSQESADKLVARLREANLPTPEPEMVEIRGRRWFRVRVGPVIEREEAEGMIEKVSEIAGAKAQVRRYP
ncbi:MAG: SPOR domain-containing protein [Gammaproteobacteria bacterium]|nr:SPOR domain-containing protein [Gammaproteobacteria bacterium]